MWFLFIFRYHFQRFIKWQQKYKYGSKIIFLWKRQDKQAYGSPDSKWSLPPTAPCNTRLATNVLLAFKVEIDTVFEGQITKSLNWPRNTAAGAAHSSPVTISRCMKVTSYKTAHCEVPRARWRGFKYHHLNITLI